MNESNALWRNYCKLALKLQRSDKLAEFLNDLRAGPLTGIAEPGLMEAAAHLVSGLAAAAVKPWDWLPPPAAADLADSAAWATQRLAAQRAAQEATERARRWDRTIAQALGGPRSSGNGNGKPVYRQQSRLSLDELIQRVERAMNRPGFQREWLDPNSKHYDRSDDGVSNKQIIMLAGLITGRQEPRSFDENWKIVTDYMNTRRTRGSQ
jgi:hypothetical protein